ncbi:MAG TPA: sensor histidine kinase N-terminal domain-containing protein, partial [Rubrivivax sp.]|nr:sensor histidine kinase N-terminal domain-containing protein [Rubrivivax sp.]
MAFGSDREQHSLFGEILDWMLAPLLLLWPMSIILTYVVAQNIAHRPYDRELAEVVRAIARQVEPAPGEPGARRTAQLQLPARAAEFLRSDEVDHAYYQVLGAHGELVAGDAALPVPEAEAEAGDDVRFRNELVRDQEVRVAYQWVPLPGEGGGQMALVQVAETLEKRARLANEIIKGVILPQFVIL